MIESAYEKMAFLAGHVHQRSLHLARLARLTINRFLERGTKSKLLVVGARRGGIFRGRVGARMAMALPAQTYQGNFHENYVSYHNYRLHGQ